MLLNMAGKKTGKKTSKKRKDKTDYYGLNYNGKKLILTTSEFNKGVSRYKKWPSK